MLRRLRRRSIFRKWLSRPPLPPLSKRLRRPSKTWAFFFCSISLSLSQAETAYYLFKRRLKWPDHYSLTFHNLFFFSFLQWVSWTFKKQHQRWRPSFVRPSVVRPSVRSLANISSKMRWRWWYPCLLFAYPRKQAFSSLKESVANKVIRRDTPWAPWKGQDEQDKAATFVCVCVFTVSWGWPLRGMKRFYTDFFKPRFSWQLIIEQSLPFSSFFGLSCHSQWIWLKLLRLVALQSRYPIYPAVTDAEKANVDIR